MSSFRERQDSVDSEGSGVLVSDVGSSEKSDGSFVHVSTPRSDFGDEFLTDLMALSRVNSEGPQTIKMWHGTNWENAQRIYGEGFIPSDNGCLGPGVYVARKDKATKFSLDRNRHLGETGGLLGVLVTYTNAKYVKSNDTSWISEGYDACRADETDFSTNMEWCIKDASQVEIISVQEITIEADADIEPAEVTRSPDKKVTGAGLQKGNGGVVPTYASKASDTIVELTAESLQRLTISLSTERRQFVCSKHGSFWKKVSSFKPVAACKLCRKQALAENPNAQTLTQQELPARLDAIPKDEERGLGYYKCGLCGTSWRSNAAVKGLGQYCQGG
jgi:hypothetical protein